MLVFVLQMKGIDRSKDLSFDRLIVIPSVHLLRASQIPLSWPV